MAQYEEHLSEFEAKNAQVLGISVDSVDTVAEWTKALGGISFPHLSDFWPHGGVATTYGVMRPVGTAQRAIFIVDRAGIIRYVHVVQERGKLPPLDEMMEALQKLA